MALYGPYGTGGTYWRFYFDVSVGSASGNSYPVNITFYLAHNGSGNYYKGADWNFNYTIAGTSYVYRYTGTQYNIANSSNYSAKSQIGNTQTVWVTLGDPRSGGTIYFSASMSDNTGHVVSPYSSGGGSGSVWLSATAGNIGTPTLSIVDNGNNTATLRGYTAGNGTNNSVSSSTLYWTTNGSQPSGGTWYTHDISIGGAGASYAHTINLPSDCNTIWAVIYSWGSYGYSINSGGHISQAVAYHTKFASSPTLTVTDLYNNTISYSGNLSTAGTNNSIKRAALFYTRNPDPATPATRPTWDSSWQPTGSTLKQDLGTTSGGSFSGTLGITNDPNTSGFYGVVICEASWSGDGTYDSGYKTFRGRFYPVAAQVANLKINHSAPSSRLTNRNITNLTWNTSTNAIGYELTISLYNTKTNTWKTEWTEDLTATSGDTYTYTFDDTKRNFIKTNYRAKDRIKVDVTAYNKDGTNKKLYARTTTLEDIFLNGAAVRIKIPEGGNSTWRLGIPWIKVNGVWKEATSLYIKNAGNWKQSI